MKVKNAPVWEPAISSQPSARYPDGPREFTPRIPVAGKLVVVVCPGEMAAEVDFPYLTAALA
jgi:hypothetical protein